MKAPSQLLIGRCSFWPEARDPDAWFRALAVLARAETSGEDHWTSPRVLANTVLRGHLSRRGVPGLFGVDPGHEPPILLGCGLLERDGGDGGAWRLSNAAKRLLATWDAGDHRDSMEQLALYLLTHSAWLRLALIKLRSGSWELHGWDRLKASNGQLRVGQSLLLGQDVHPDDWLCGIAQSVIGAWRSGYPADATPTIRIHAPKTAKPDDGLSLSPLKSPLYLLDSLGWLDAAGHLRLPPDLALQPWLAPLLGRTGSAAARLDQATAAHADHRGVFPLEPVFLQFARDLGVFPDARASDPAFIAWTDQLLSQAFREGVIELFSSEPGQPRHGRGLFGDPQQKLLRWRVHEGFDALCEQMSPATFQSPTAIPS